MVQFLIIDFLQIFVVVIVVCSMYVVLRLLCVLCMKYLNWQNGLFFVGLMW